jgi:hypothetical protein
MAGVAAAGLGCGGESYGTITGKVYFKGEPMDGGSITFYSQANKSKIQSAPIGSDGTYTLSKMITGPAKITVTSAPPDVFKGAPDQLPPSDKDLPRDKAAIEVKKLAAKGKHVPIPAEVMDSKKTPLSYTVIKGNQKHDVKID